MTTPTQLRTERLLLRSFVPSDIPQIVRLAGARQVAATTLRIPHPYSEADAEQFLAHCEEECRRGAAAVFAIADAGGTLCGAVGLHLDEANRRAELGYWIGLPFWGRGYATEAARAVVRYGFEELKLNRIFASHFKGNEVSGQVLRKIGMRYEGRSRQHVLKWGEFVDLELYGMLAEESGPGPSSSPS